ncbi:MAG TPA: type II secretion system minor pseudopilin GspK [Aquabacterium sp.]|nr:type II secretion system minor pseudopilin GspK [Aquabacterium sp.]
MTPRAPVRPRHGAALLVAMVLLSVVATLAAGMVWQQWRAVQVETAVRARTQAGWLLLGAEDWARLILREARATPVSLNDAWASPLAETRLSSFLAADRDNNADAGPEAFLAGAISDAQARYNLRNLIVENKVDAKQQQILERLCTSVGLGPDTAALLSASLLASQQGDAGEVPLPPQQLDDLAWVGLPPEVLARLAQVAVLLPAPTPVNLNTASREVLAGVVEGLDLGSADRLVAARQRRALQNLGDATAIVGAGPKLNDRDVDVKSAFFEVRGRLRLESRVLESRSLLERRGNRELVVVWRQQQASLVRAAP